MHNYIFLKFLDNPCFISSFSSAVAHILTHLGKVSDPLVIMAALLHDTVEDTDTTLDEIEREFGPQVKSIVVELTDNKLMTRDERKRWQVKENVSNKEY